MTESASDPNVVPSHGHIASQNDRVGQAMAGLKAAGDSGASWFFWIAALSLVNTAVTHSGGDHHFIVGMAITMIVDAFASVIGKQNPEIATVLMIVAIGFSIFVSGIACLFGWLSRKRILWIFGTGMFVYLLDGLLYVLFEDYLSAAFHGYALYSMFQGFNAYRKMKQLEMAVQSAASENTTTANVSDASGFEPA